MGKIREGLDYDESISTLVDLGLSILQAKIYLTILTQNSSTAKTISDFSKVSRPDVYRIIAGLEELGLVERILSKPTSKYQAIPIEACISILMQQRVRSLSEIKKKVPVFVKRIKKISSKGQIALAPKSEFSLISKEGFILRVEKVTKDAKKSIFAVIPTEKTVLRPSNLQSALEEALSKNVNFRIVMLEPKNKRLQNMVSKRAALFKNFQVRVVRNKPKTAIVIFDGKQVLIATSSIENNDFLALWSDNENIVDLSQTYFYNQWKKAS